MILRKPVLVGALGSENRQFFERISWFSYLTRVSQHSKMHTCRAVFDEFLAHCEIAVSRNELAATTVTSYRNTLHSVWRPELDELPFLGVDFIILNRIANSHKQWSHKTYNNAISVLRRAFAFGYQSYPTEVNPALGLRLARLRRHERPRADPFRIYDAELLIAALHRDWGEAQGNYDEFRIFSGLRPSEQIALTIHDYDPRAGTVQITKARVHGIDRDYTKTGQDRVLALNPRAIRVLNRQLCLRERLRASGRLHTSSCSFIPAANLFEPWTKQSAAGGAR